MSKKYDYNIEFLGLADGKHSFNFHVNKELFLQYENADVTDADVNVDIELNKNVRHLSLHFEIKGNIKTLCDRCMETLTLQIDYTTNLYVNFGDYTSDLTNIDDVMTLNRSEEKLELSKHLYDYIMLNIPIQRVHNGENGEHCNPDMLKQIEKYKIGNNNSETNEIDPRWDKLKHLYN